MICPVGQDSKGESECKKCPKGSYKTEHGIRDCVSCGDGYYTKREGAASEKECFGKYVQVLIGTDCHFYFLLRKKIELHNHAFQNFSK